MSLGARSGMYDGVTGDQYLVSPALL